MHLGKPIPNPQGTAARVAVIGLLWIAVAGGCTSEEKPKIADYLDELEFSAPTESIAYVSLGRFSVPIPERPAQKQKRSVGIFAELDGNDSEESWVAPAYRLHIRFELVAETSPESESDLLEAIERRRGLIDDTVLTTCRSISPDDLADPRFAALKSRLTDDLRPLLGQNRVRQLVIKDYVEQRY